jgi:sec-independent protein translocase protein TatC
MLLTPPDPFTQSMLALPMWALFELGIFAGKVMRKRQQQQEQQAGSRQS